MQVQRLLLVPQIKVLQRLIYSGVLHLKASITTDRHRITLGLKQEPQTSMAVLVLSFMQVVVITKVMTLDLLLKGHSL